MHTWQSGCPAGIHSAENCTSTTKAKLQVEGTICLGHTNAKYLSWLECQIITAAFAQLRHQSCSLQPQQHKTTALSAVPFTTSKNDVEGVSAVVHDHLRHILVQACQNYAGGWMFEPWKFHYHDHHCWSCCREPQWLGWLRDTKSVVIESQLSKPHSRHNLNRKVVLCWMGNLHEKPKSPLAKSTCV